MIPLGILFSFLSLSILSWVIYSSVKTPFLRSLKTRRTNIEETVNQSRLALKEANNLLKMFKAKLGGVDDERVIMLAKMKIDLKKMRERMILEAKELGENIRITAHRTAGQEFRVAKARLQWQLASAAINLAKEKLEKHLTKDDDLSLQEEALNNLGNNQYGKSITREALRESVI